MFICRLVQGVREIWPDSKVKWIFRTLCVLPWTMINELELHYCLLHWAVLSLPTTNIFSRRNGHYYSENYKITCLDKKKIWQYFLTPPVYCRYSHSIRLSKRRWINRSWVQISALIRVFSLEFFGAKRPLQATLSLYPLYVCMSTRYDSDSSLSAYRAPRESCF